MFHVKYLSEKYRLNLGLLPKNMAKFKQFKKSGNLTMQIPQDILYADTHMWAQQSTDGTWLVGVTDYAQDLLGDVVFIDPPKASQTLTQGQACGLIESVKTGSDLHAPLSGAVIAINEDLLGAPEGINDRPYKSWIFKMSADAHGADLLLNADQYATLTAA